MTHHARILKKYFDEETWEVVTQEQVEKWFEGFYLDVKLALDDLFAGETIYTDVAEYRIESMPAQS